MATVFGTLGFLPEKMIPVIRSRTAEKVVVFYDRHPKSLQAHVDVVAYCNELEIPIEGVELDAFDLADAAAQIRAKARQHEDVIFNVTGGTKILSSAAMLVCILEGIPAVYLREDNREEVRLPLLTLRYERHLSQAGRRVLRCIYAAPGATSKDIAMKTGLAKPTVAHHVDKLVGYGLVTSEVDAKDRRRKLLTTIPTVSLLLDP